MRLKVADLMVGKDQVRAYICRVRGRLVGGWRLVVGWWAAASVGEAVVRLKVADLMVGKDQVRARAMKVGWCSAVGGWWLGVGSGQPRGGGGAADLMVG